MGIFKIFGKTSSVNLLLRFFKKKFALNKLIIKNKLHYKLTPLTMFFSVSHPDYPRTVRRSCSISDIGTRCFNEPGIRNQTVSHCQTSCKTTGCNQSTSLPCVVLDFLKITLLANSAMQNKLCNRNKCSSMTQ